MKSNITFFEAEVSAKVVNLRSSVELESPLRRPFQSSEEAKTIPQIGISADFQSLSMAEIDEINQQCS